VGRQRPRGETRGETRGRGQKSTDEKSISVTAEQREAHKRGAVRRKINRMNNLSLLLKCRERAIHGTQTSRSGWLVGAAKLPARDKLGARS